MYRAYATLKNWYFLGIRLHYTNTDLLIFLAKSYNLYKTILDVPILRKLMDLSKLPANHSSGVGHPNCQNKGILGKLNVLCHVKYVIRDCAIVTCDCAILT